ncbi:hypothetical protein PGTUg99_002995 [Puccinia graminis f. sp. tritici]|uniref:Uncharacterized protein n=1 Tax=Puccinia graminis f. sp. tritici TaxID=56615 RepID=A0A5B0R9V4_PUCGR|nr:hypothetical protein PGTUg99_002995 [Puccinia graminis f. sp. tritici]
MQIQPLRLHRCSPPTKSAAAIRLIQAARQSFAGCQSHGCPCPAHQAIQNQHSPTDIRSAARSILSNGRARSFAAPSTPSLNMLSRSPPLN